MSYSDSISSSGNVRQPDINPFNLPADSSQSSIAGRHTTLIESEFPPHLNPHLLRRQNSQVDEPAPLSGRGSIIESDDDEDEIDEVFQRAVSSTPKQGNLKNPDALELQQYFEVVGDDEISGRVSDNFQKGQLGIRKSWENMPYAIIKWEIGLDGKTKYFKPECLEGHQDEADKLQKYIDKKIKEKIWGDKPDRTPIEQALTDFIGDKADIEDVKVIDDNKMEINVKLKEGGEEYKITLLDPKLIQKLKDHAEGQTPLQQEALDTINAWANFVKDTLTVLEAVKDDDQNAAMAISSSPDGTFQISKVSTFTLVPSADSKKKEDHEDDFKMNETQSFKDYIAHLQSRLQKAPKDEKTDKLKNSLKILGRCIDIAEKNIIRKHFDNLYKEGTETTPHTPPSA